MTQPERSEVTWGLLFGIDCALRQLEHALPPWVRIILEVDTTPGNAPLQLQYGADSTPEDLEGFVREAEGHQLRIWEPDTAA
jgi:hypothetical protein